MHAQAAIRNRNQAVSRYSPMVRRMAHRMLSRLPANVELDDMVQAGMMGLMDAAERYQGGQGAQFETYAAQRIRGAMLDGLRDSDWLPRSVRRSQRRIDAASNAVAHRKGRRPTEAELAAELDLPLAECRRMLGEAHCGQLVHAEDLSGGLDALAPQGRDAADAAADPLARLEDRRFRAALVAAIGRLPERERQVMGMYYEQDLNLREIAHVLGVTESRVCQLHGRAVRRLRERLRGC
jgi:RNA polymerase sigma factor for flagellar operon FliA